MATITKKMSALVPSANANQYWASSENNDDGTSIVQGDIFMIEDSLKRPATYLWIETDASCDLKIRFNNYFLHIPKKDYSSAEFNNIRVPNFTGQSWITDTSIAEVPILASQEWEINNAFPIRTIQVSTWTAGTFNLFVA